MCEIELCWRLISSSTVRFSQAVVSLGPEDPISYTWLVGVTAWLPDHPISHSPLGFVGIGAYGALDGAPIDGVLLLIGVVVAAVWRLEEVKMKI